MSYRDRLYGGYVTTHLGNEELKERLQLRGPFMKALVKEHFPSNKEARILELGCGYGALIHYAKALGYTNVSGVDVSPEQVRAAQKFGIEGVEVGDISLALKNLESGSLDVVVTVDVIEHFTRDELLELVDDIYRVLREGGCWITHQPNAASPFFGRIRYGDLTHEMAYTAESMRQLVLTCGFKQVTCHEDTPVAHGWKSLIRRAMWRFIAWTLFFFLAIETGTTKEFFSQNFLAVAKKE